MVRFNNMVRLSSPTCGTVVPDENCIFIGPNLSSEFWLLNDVFCMENFDLEVVIIIHYIQLHYV